MHVRFDVVDIDGLQTRANAGRECNTFAVVRQRRIAHRGLIGDTGDDTVVGGAGNDYIEGNNGNDSLMGEDGNDEIRGQDGDDTISGGSGNDELYGDGYGRSLRPRYPGDYIDNPGNDLLYGEDGDDLLFGSAGSDLLSGGVGADRALDHAAEPL